MCAARRAGRRWRAVIRALTLVGMLSWALGCSGCSAGFAASTDIHRSDGFLAHAAPHSHVLLVPSLLGGTAGWCMATATSIPGTGGSSGCGGSRTSSGPIFTESCEGAESRTVVYALTTAEVAAVSVAGSTAIATTSNPTLPEGLRALAVELQGYRWQPKNPETHPCPPMVPFDGAGQPVERVAKPTVPLLLLLHRSVWEAPNRPHPSPCRIGAPRLPRATVAAEGAVALQVRSVPGLLGRAFLSCADTTYIYRGEHHFRAAVLLDAANPGATPPPLPDISQVAGRTAIFEAPGASGTMVARRIPGAWLVVEETDDIGLRIPLELLEDLRPAVHL